MIATNNVSKSNRWKDERQADCYNKDSKGRHHKASVSCNRKRKER